jgi:CHAT domain-containing protein
VVAGGPTLTSEARENPLLRSGLALAGANQLISGNDDGILTAMEAAGLDLWGTQLVVLSACETGVGKVTNGDGVYGLRRALIIAGAESLVMSLWQVDDAATRDLMAGYYARLAAGKPRSSALRDIQLEIQGKPKYAHPYYWASFLPAGDDAPLGPTR